MRLYIDTADLDAVTEFMGTGLFGGVTCNPVILKAGGFGPATAGDFFNRCRDAGAKEVFLQSFGRTADEVVEQGLKYSEFGPELVVKVVSSRNGAIAATQLRAHGARVLLTAVHNAKQTLVAIAANANFVTPYLSEINRAGHDGLAEASAMQRILTASDTSTELVMAGVSDTNALVRFAEEGVRYATMTPDIAGVLLDEPLSNAMEDMFNEVSIS